MYTCRFLNSILHLAHAAEHRTDGWGDQGRLSRLDKRAPEYDSLPQNAASQPDLVYFGVAEWSTTLQGTQA